MIAARPLAQILAETSEGAGHWRPVYDEFVDRLRALGVGSGAPRVGDRFPGFALPDSAGQYRTLDGLIGEGPLVLSFNRGGWCPYCTHELRAWGEAIPDLIAAGGHFVAVTPEVGGRAALLSHVLGAQADLLCDVDHGVALSTGLAFYVGKSLLEQYRDWGLDLAEVYGNSSGFLPVPATFVSDRAGITRFAFTDPDFRIRAEPRDVLATVAALV